MIFWTLLLILGHFSEGKEVLSDDVLDIAAEYHQQKSEVFNLEDKKRKMLSEIYNLEKDTQKIILKKSELDEKNTILNYDMIEISKQIIETSHELSELAPDIINRSSLLEQINSLPWFYAIMSSLTLTDLDRLHRSAQNMNDHQTEQLAHYLALSDRLVLEKQKLNKTARHLIGLKKQISKEELSIEKNQKNKSQSLKKLEKEIAQEKLRMNQLKDIGKQKALASELKDLQMLFGTEFFDRKGQLMTPVEGELSQVYGLNQSLVHDSIELLHKGHFYKTPQKTLVKSIAEGRVQFAGSVPGFGHTIIIDHGGRYYSVYSNLAKTKVNEKSIVKENQEIGMTGHIHLQQGVGLYFEIRHFSEAQNPQQWLKPQPTSLAQVFKKDL